MRIYISFSLILSFSLAQDRVLLQWSVCGCAVQVFTSSEFAQLHARSVERTGYPLQADNENIPVMILKIEKKKAASLPEFE